MNRLVVYLFAVGPMCAFARAEFEIPPTRTSAEPLSGIALANNHFGLNLFKQLSSSDENAANVFLSPYSVATALAMLHQGTAGNTSEQFARVLGYSSPAQLYNTAEEAKSLTDISAKIGESDRQISPDGPIDGKQVDDVDGYVVRTANALVVNTHFAIRDKYNQSLTQNFRAQTYSVDFTHDSAAAKELINGWVSQKTMGKIDNILSQPLPESTQIALINAVYFKGMWARPFEPSDTKPGVFTGRGGKIFDNVPFMYRSGSFPIAYINEHNATLIEMPYIGSTVSMFAILPNQNNSNLAKQKAMLEPQFIEAAINRTRAKHIYLHFPKLDFKTSYDLVSTLQALGLMAPFNAAVSDYSRLSTSAERMAISLVKHMATIEVNEKGTEATGATLVSVTKTTSPTFRFDHPFLFFIRHNPTAQILFIGEVNRFD